MEIVEIVKTDKVNINEGILSIVYNEYSYELQRTNTLDNKVYIALTISSALLAFDANQIDFNKIFSTQINKLILIYIIITFLIMGIILCLYFLIVKKLFSALKPRQYYKFDSKEIDLSNQNEYTYKTLIDITTSNTMTNNEKADELNKAFNLFPMLLILSVLYFFISNFI